MIKCNADERCRRRLDGGEPLFLPTAKMQTSPSAPARNPTAKAVGFFCYSGYMGAGGCTFSVFSHFSCFFDIFPVELEWKDVCE